MNLKLLSTASTSVLALMLAGCATQSSRVLPAQTVASPMSSTQYQGTKYAISIGNFQNRSSYQQGLFSSGTDQLGSQAKTILMTHLQQTGRFNVMDRANMEQLAAEAKYRGATQAIRGASIVVTGDVTEFGRRVTGDQQLFGILGQGKKQTAYAKVALNLVNTQTSEVIYSAQGAGEYELSNREVIGFGGTSGYDSTLNGKVLNLAITEAVNNLVVGLESGAFALSGQ